MWNKLISSIDFGKLTINSIPGFFAGTALLLLVDAFTPGHLTQDLLNPNSPAGTKVVEAFMVIVGSAAFGLLIDNIYATFGRWFAMKFWKPLQIQFDYRNCMMDNLGLSKEEFEWVQSNDPNKANEVESKYLRFTEVAGSSAYALSLLAVAVELFLTFKYHQSIALSLPVAAAVGIIAIILLVTSAASLSKYEMNKTASAMDVIRKMSSHNFTYKETSMGKGFWQKFTKYAWWLPGFLVIMLVLPLPWVIHSSIKYDSVKTPKVISVLNSDDSLPTLQINLTAAVTPPATVNNSILITLEKTVKTLTPMSPADSLKYLNFAGQTAAPDQPPWSLFISLGDVVESNNTVVLNAELSSVVPVNPGTWQFPVIVTDDKSTRYLLAYVKVNIAPMPVETTTVSNTGTSSNQISGSPSTGTVTTTQVSSSVTTTTVK